MKNNLYENDRQYEWVIEGEYLNRTFEVLTFKANTYHAYDMFEALCKFNKQYKFKLFNKTEELQYA